MKSKEIEQRLREIFADRLLMDVSDLVSYGFDASFGQYMPDYVVQVLSTEDVQNVVKLADEYIIPIYARGASTSLSGGALPVKGGIVVDFSQWNDEFEIYPDDLIIKTRPGVITGKIHALAEKHNLMYPPDPSSSVVCTIGGNLAENAGGPRGIKYGVTKDYVIGLEVVMPDGEVIRTGGQTIKNVTGYDLTKLLIGSEGTLGIITEATLRLIPKPLATKTAMVIFDDLYTAGKSISKILTSGVRPSKMEILDHNALNKVEDYAGLDLPRDAAAILLIEVDGNPENLGDELDTIKKALKEIDVENVEIAESKEAEDKLWQVRKLVSPAVVESGYTKISEDATVPLSKIPEMFKKIDEIKTKYDLNIVVFGHAGDGNLHPTINTNMRDENEVRKTEDAVEEIFNYAIELGGTLSGEHGIGVMKKAFIKKEMGEAGVRYQQMIKKALDPKNILNPGKIFPEKGEERLVLRNE
ncbi:FAD-linked oxidase C-terminal domain-containing protein [Mammaliicoccus lentus]|uniref:FAD-linked oxidase C-terminal domain-containing protein n=2 Tax=Mammaliicoccus lentus TaxID=42858 RepID=A0AAX3W3H6_MAMLE|nr:FAD-linked oxidase C-terminal domain-containing protein [Mammaliicoccus lentus]HBV03000.1 FAD-binding protein [Staphylococcus sp.]MBW0767355.1 FAD-binding protein [Mammaliicoccus lentus]MDQ7142788.1 FAD-linked oxidase C-terminal domain-containing protein [Mammaliicoccus lentus]POA05788.1 glycolate oxidase subunit GlcD [Mammaliicoccus lentus]WHI54939.1 FAD-linked oxidase C-terminal domain-containing protein [Mammaliicoccus lentus]